MKAHDIYVRHWNSKRIERYLTSYDWNERDGSVGSFERLYEEIKERFMLKKFSGNCHWHGKLLFPGVSGGTMMVAMGIYDKLIHSITHLRKEFKESLRFLIPIFVGVGAALVIVARILEFCF